MTYTDHLYIILHQCALTSESAHISSLKVPRNGHTHPLRGLVRDLLKAKKKQPMRSNKKEYHGTSWDQAAN